MTVDIWQWHFAILNNASLCVKLCEGKYILKELYALTYSTSDFLSWIPGSAWNTGSQSMVAPAWNLLPCAAEPGYAGDIGAIEIWLIETGQLLQRNLDLYWIPVYFRRSVWKARNVNQSGLELNNGHMPSHILPTPETFNQSINQSINVHFRHSVWKARNVNQSGLELNNGHMPSHILPTPETINQSINQSKFYSANIPGVARLSGATSKSVLNSEIDEAVPQHRQVIIGHGGVYRGKARSNRYVLTHFPAGGNWRGTDKLFQREGAQELNDLFPALVLTLGTDKVISLFDLSERDGSGVASKKCR